MWDVSEKGAESRGRSAIPLLVFVLASALAMPSLARASLVTLNGVAGTGPLNQWIAGGTSVGVDNSALGGTASSVGTTNQVLAVPLANPGVSGTIRAVTLGGYFKCSG